MRVALGVLAEPPTPGCLPKLLAAHSSEWAAGLYAAMLRDTLDGLQSVDASAYLVFAAAEDPGGALARHVPAPWQIVTGVEDPALALARLGAESGLALLARSDAPSAPVEPLIDLTRRAVTGPFAVLGPSPQGDAWLIGAHQLDPGALGQLPWGSPELAATMRVRCTRAEVALEEIAPATIVDEPSAVLTLLEELRRHPERAPRAAQYVVTHG